MRKLLILSCFLPMLGCLNRAFVKAVDGYTTVILPEYKEYVVKDTTLDEDTKRIRTQSADKFQELVDDAKKDGKDE